MGDVVGIKGGVGSQDDCPWAPGDIVTLQSGGLRMTVNEINREDGATLVECTWHGENGIPFFADYAPQALRARP